MKKYFLPLLVLVLFIACESSEEPLKFEEKHVSSTDGASIDITYPFYTENSDRANLINEQITNVISNAINPMDTLKNVSIEKAADMFKNTYEQFIKDFEDSNQKWEANTEGEETYQSPQVLSVSINSYVDTGGAHGNTVINLLNFNPDNGKLYENADMLEINDSLLKLVETRFLEAIKRKSVKSDLKDYFFGEEFHLPENIGFSEEGVIFLYNTYEASAYSLGITEFEISFDELANYLKIQ